MGAIPPHDHSLPYGWMTPWTKMLLALWMALGRLEVVALIVLLTPRFWRED